MVIPPVGHSYEERDWTLFEICGAHIRHEEEIVVLEEVVDSVENITSPLKYAYYTESDQIVVYDEFETFRALTSATDNMTLIVGRRKTKNERSDPKAYLGQLDSWRDCCNFGYALNWPNSSRIYPTSSSENEAGGGKRRRGGVGEGPRGEYQERSGDSEGGIIQSKRIGSNYGTLVDIIYKWLFDYYGILRV